jgi:flavin-dependent dehydrogenase
MNTSSCSTEEEIFDVIIVGMGLAGAASAITLARRGLRVLALESDDFPRQKVCGEFLSPEGRASLGRLQVLEAVQESGAGAVREARIFAPNGRFFHAELEQPALSISRWSLDTLLCEAAQTSGAFVLTRHRVSEITPPRSEEQPWCVRTNGRVFFSRHLLVTAGRNAPWWKREASDSLQPRFVGLKAHFDAPFGLGELEEGRVELHAWHGGYCGLMRIEGGAINASLLTRYETLRGESPQRFWEKRLAELPALRERMKHATPRFDWIATGNVRFSPPTPLRTLEKSPWEPVMCAGDASGFIHPLTGDGMAMALRGGELAAATIAAAQQNGWTRAEMNQLHAGAWTREFVGRLRWSRVAQALLIEPRLSRAASWSFSRSPGLARMFFARTRGALPA